MGTGTRGLGGPSKFYLQQKSLPSAKKFAFNRIITWCVTWCMKYWCGVVSEHFEYHATSLRIWACHVTGCSESLTEFFFTKCAVVSIFCALRAQRGAVMDRSTVARDGPLEGPIQPIVRSQGPSGRADGSIDLLGLGSSRIAFSQIIAFGQIIKTKYFSSQQHFTVCEIFAKTCVIPSVDGPQPRARSSPTIVRAVVARKNKNPQF